MEPPLVQEDVFLYEAEGLLGATSPSGAKIQIEIYTYLIRIKTQGSSCTLGVSFLCNNLIFNLYSSINIYPSVTTLHPLITPPFRCLLKVGHLYISKIGHLHVR